MKTLRNLEVRNYGGVVSRTAAAVDLGLGRLQQFVHFTVVHGR
jgi:hypothetical protein